jgi:hypothetical protein
MECIIEEMPCLASYRLIGGNVWRYRGTNEDYPWGHHYNAMCEYQTCCEYHNPFQVSVVPQNYSILTDIIRINGWRRDEGQIIFVNDPDDYGWWFEQNKLWLNGGDEDDFNTYHPGAWQDDDSDESYYIDDSD